MASVDLNRTELTLGSIGQKIPTRRVKLDFTQEAAHTLCSGGRQAFGAILLKPNIWLVLWVQWFVSGENKVRKI